MNKTILWLLSHFTGQAHVKNWVQYIPAAVSLVSGLLGNKSSKKAAAAEAERARQALARGKEQNEYNKMAAKAAEASGQLQSFDIKRQAKLMASRAVAVAAAGGYAGDIDNLIADIDGEANYKSSIALYEAGDFAEGLRFEGAQAEKYGAADSRAASQRSSAYKLEGQASLLAGFGNAWGAYSRANP